ncbi:MAG: hypothetical protein HZA91_20515 [Verrucomicrobia bacterium]|nr:hypothetical protein [Verrucomicrobiota bacterium]
MPTEIIVSKLDAARRQLETAIRLYFHGTDPVSIHTLTAAAYNVLRDLNQDHGKMPMLCKDVFPKMVKPEFEDECKKKLNEAENFFKHADKDPDAILTFRSGQTEWLLFEACYKYSELTAENVPLLALFKCWFVASKPNCFNFTPEFPSPPEDILRLAVQGHRQFFMQKFLPHLLEFVS